MEKTQMQRLHTSRTRRMTKQERGLWTLMNLFGCQEFQTSPGLQHSWLSTHLVIQAGRNSDATDRLINAGSRSRHRLGKFQTWMENYSFSFIYENKQQDGTL